MASKSRIIIPEDTQECSLCLMDDRHPFGLTLNGNFICTGCREKEKMVNENQLRILKSYIYETLNSIPDRNEEFDCVIPISGDKESFFTVKYVIEKLKLKPLCTFFNHHFNTDVGLENLQNLTHYFDLLLVEFTPYIKHYKEIVRSDLLLHGNVNRFNVSSQIALALKQAKRNRIPLIFWGKHQGVEYTGMFAKKDKVEFSHQYWRMFDNLKKEYTDYPNISDGAKDLLKSFDLITTSDFDRSKVIGIYLSNYMNWSTYKNFKEISKSYSFKRAVTCRSCFDYEYSGNYFYYSWHDV
ncbi:hypothetical protein OA416_03845, partial [Paracoccaceae bacterium]|nr:hypothetical protein [Paracoccaceae bacterium]